jgi:hypothetical protein
MNEVLASSSSSRCSIVSDRSPQSIENTFAFSPSRCGIGGIALPTLTASEAAHPPQRVHRTTISL